MIHAGFLRSCEIYAEKVALTSPERQMTYDEVYHAALRVAGSLTRLGQNPDGVVAVYGGKSLEAIVVILGVLLAGRPYSFLNPAQTWPRVKRMVEVLRPDVLVDLDAGVPRDDIDRKVTVVGREALGGEALQAPRQGNSPTAYVLFTSGSTGMPKGVAVGHRAAALAQKAFVDAVGLEADDVVSNEVALNFDVSTFDVFATLAVGGTVDVTPEAVLDDGSRYAAYLGERGITSLFTVPTVIRDMEPYAAAFGGLRRLMLTGELISKPVARILRPLIAKGVVYNCYGMTEAPWALAYRLRNDDVETPNLLERSGPCVEVELRDGGEICLKGAGLMQGYVTADVPLGALSETAAAYATGDFVEEAGDCFRLLGRRGRHVRLLGHRIELDEIEYWLEQCPQVALSMVVHDVEAEQLRAVVAVSPDEEESPEALWAHVKTVLPGYMWPAGIVWVAEIPRTVSGKKDYSRFAQVAGGR